MNSAWKLFLAILLSAVAVAVFMYPQMMVSPGHLNTAHKQIENDCFACHSPLRGISEERCTQCHNPVDIGKTDTTGKAIVTPKTKVPFHQQLINKDCVACHSDHTGVIRLKKTGHFQHALLATETRQQCNSCHKAPNDKLHGKMIGQCSQCHTSQKWRPATFDHNRYFALDGDHNTECETCHVKNNYSTYTCYGCHEHSPANIREEHLEEGINNVDNCVKCHRNANEDDIRRVMEPDRYTLPRSNGYKNQDDD